MLVGGTRHPSHGNHVTCCGPLVETTDQDDPERIYLCTICGKQGGEDVFHDPPPEGPGPPTFRARISGWLHKLADKV